MRQAATAQVLKIVAQGGHSTEIRARALLLPFDLK